MNKRINIAMVFLLILIGQTAGVRAAELEIYTEEYPPVSFSKDGKASGLATEVVQEILLRLNLTIPIQVVPWARGYKTALEKADVVLFATAKTDEREKLFKWVGPIVRLTTSFYAQKGSGIKINSLNDAKKLIGIGVTREYYSEQFLKKQGFTNLDTSISPAQMLKKQFKGRHPVIASDNISLPALLQQENASVSDVELLFTFMISDCYIAFSLGTSDETVRRWQKTMDEMKKDGTFASIYQKWLPGEAPPGFE